MGVHRKIRTPDEIMCDMLADGESFEDIARRLLVSPYAVEARFRVICAKLGSQAK